MILATTPDADPANATAYQEAFEAVDDYMQNECGQ